MKYGIITHYDVHNHGALLQLNGLAKVLNGLGISASALQFEKSYDFLGLEIKAKYEISLKSVGIYLNYLKENGVGQTLYNYKKKKVLEAFKAQEKLVGDYYTECEDLDGVVGENLEAKIPTALKAIGADYVFDVTFGADLTIMEEASELIDRIKNNNRLPLFTSCCPAWVRYMEIYHPNLVKHLSTCKSPIGMQGAIIKSYFAEMMGIPSENIISVAITPCTAKKSEIALPNNKDTDFVITTSELALMIRESEIDFNNLKDEPYDSIMGRGSGAGVIFGNSGGVMEAAVRTAYHFLTNESPNNELLSFTKVRGYDNVKEAEVIIGDKELKLLVVHGMTNVEPILKELSRLKARDGVFMVLGNHDTGAYVKNSNLSTREANKAALSDKMSGAGWVLLRDSTVYIHCAADSIAVTGIDYNEELLKYKHSLDAVRLPQR